MRKIVELKQTIINAVCRYGRMTRPELATLTAERAAGIVEAVDELKTGRTFDRTGAQRGQDRTQSAAS